MAKNPFDQFDAPAAANPFDQFDTPVAAPPQGIASASPTAAVEPGLGGGAASKTVSKGFSLPPVLDPLGINQPPQPVATFKAGTPGYSVLGELPPPTPMPTGVRDDFIGQVRGELVRVTPAQRLALANDPSLKGQVAKSLLDSEPTTFAPRAPATMRETPLPTQIGMDIRRNVTNPVALGAISGLAGVGQVLPGLVQAGADLVGANDVADFAAGVSATGRQISAPLRPKAGNERLVFDVFNSITQSAPTLLTGLGGGPAMTMLFTQSAAQEYSEGRSRGLSGDQAAARAGIMAGAEVIGERLGFGEQMKLLRGITRGMPIEQLAPTFAREVVKNATGEQLTTLIQFLGDKYGPGALNPEAKLADYLTQAGDTLKVSLGQSAVMAGGPAAIQKARSTFRRQERDQLSRAVDMPAANPFDQFDATATTAPTAAPVQAPYQAGPESIQASAPVATAQPGEIAAPAQPEPQPALTPAADSQRVSTLTGRQIDTRLRVLDASQLQAATGELQPRDRSRAASDEQINTIAAQLDPQRLGASAEADRGAPIIGPDMIVESGNGRVQGIRRAYAMYPERAQAYRDFLTAQGYDLTGINEPVLVRERLTPLSDQDRVAFVQEANQSATMDLTPVERAKIDVSALTDGVVEVWYGGEITDAANRDFVRGFIGQLPQAQRNGLLDDNGALSPDGAQRIRRALLAAAYEDRDLLVKLVESTDDNIKSIGNALFDSSGQWLQMRRMAREGLIDSSYDVTAELVQAARVVDQLRQSRGKVQEWLAQEDLATPRNPIVDEFVRAFYNANLTRAVGRDAIAEVLKAYVDMARSQDTDGLFGDSPLPDQMVRGAVEQRNERNKEPVTGNLFDVAQPQSDAGAQPSVRQGRGGQADSAVSGGGAKPARESAGGQLLATEDRRRTQAQDRNGPRADAEEGVSRGANRDTAGDAPADRGLEARGKAAAGQDQNQRFKGATGDVFIKASFTNRQSIYRDAFVELGYDPTEAELLPPDRQFMILADGLKKTYGLALVQKADRANLRDAIDQLLDAYRGLQLMAHVLDLPTKAIGLNGELALGLVKNAGYLGAHYPLGTGDGASAGGIATSTQTIVMPGRSNSFAHEWGHALDFYLANKHSGALANLSDHLREGETLADQFPESTGEAFRHLLNAIFFDRAEQSAKIMELERKIEAATQAGKDTAKLKADLANLMSGASKSRNDRSQFYKSAGEFAKATGSDVDYWRKPTEMLARSFEAYISHKVEAAGGTTEFIGKSDAAYQSDAHIRLAKTFPKDADRYNIFRAYDLLFDAIRSDALLNPNGDAVAEMPAGVRLTDPAVYFDDQIRSAQSPAIKRAWEEEKRAWRVRARELEKLAERPSDPRPLMKRMGDAVRAALVTNRGVLLAMERHYAKTGNQSAANAIRQVMERIATDPGSGRKTFAGGTYAEAVERESRRFMTRLSNIRNAADADMMSDADLAQLTAVLTTTEEYTPQIMQAKNPAINKLGAQLRELLTDLYYYNRNAGLDIGFVKDQGYLPRLIDEPVVTANAAEFVRDATEVYKIIFERDTERPMDADDIVLALQALEKRARDAGMDLKRDPELDAYRAARKELTKLLRAMNSIDENDPDSADKIDKAQAALKEFLEQSGDVFEQAYDYIRDVWSGNAAAEYQTRISYGSPENFSSHSPAGSYLKERTLPPEADKILAKYYVQDPIERVTKYLQMSVRKSEYNLRFGRDSRGREKNTKLYRMLEQMVNSGVRKEDRDMVERIVGQVTGTDRNNMPGEYQRFLGNVHALGQMALLGRVVLTSLAEPITTAVQTGKPLDALKAVALTIQEIASTGSVRERRAMARVLGIVSGDYADEMIANRLGGTFAESPNMTKVSANYFRRVGLTGLTNAQRRSAMQLSGRYVLELAHTLDDDQASDSDKGFARAELTDAGIQPEQIEAFVEWSREYTSRMPRHDELMDVDGSLTDMGQIYAVMVGRLVNQAIQSPTAVDRPWAANTPVGRLTYGLLSFSMAFFRNIMMKSVKKVEREYNERGAAQAASVAAFQVLAPIASLYVGHLLVTIMREALLNPDKWEEEEKKEGGFPIKWLAQLAFSRSGFTGLADPLYNALMGVKYQRDLSNLLAGATPSFALQALERIAKYFVVNSANTNSAERNAARGLYELTVQPGLAYVTGALPGGPAVGYGLGASYMYMTSPAFKSQWQTWLAGEKESKQKKAGSGQQEDRL